MRKRILILTILLGGMEPAALAVVNNVRVMGVTHAQAMLGYTAPSEAACTVEISKQPSFTPLAHDVDPALFAGAGNDGGGGRARLFNIGKMTVGTGLDSKNYSRALQTATVHYYRITCGTDVLTGTFETRNLPLGMTYVPNQPVDGTSGLWLQPTISYTDRTQEIVDPITGVLLKRLILPRDEIYEYDFADASAGAGAAWTTPNNIAGAPDGSFASYSGTAQEKLVVNLRTAFQSVGLGFDFISVKFKGFGSGASSAQRTIQVCISTDNTTCEGSVTDIVLPASNDFVYYNQSKVLQDMMGANNLDPFQVRIFTGAQLLVWKKATSGTDTVSLDGISTYWGESIRGISTAAGFHDFCGIPDSGSWIKCVVSGGMYAIHLPDGEVRHMGVFGYFSSAFGLGTGFNDCFTFGGGSRLFSTTNPNQFYCGLTRWNLDATNTAVAGGSIDSNQAIMVISNPTPLLAAGGPNLETLIHQFDSTLPPNWSCQPDAVQGTYILGACHAGSQDGYAYTWVFSLGNNTPMDDASCGTIANGKCGNSGVGIVAANAVWRSAVSRYSTFHTMHSQGNTPVMGYETQGPRGGHLWDNDPVAVTLAGSINSTQTNITVTSAYPGGAVAQPGTLTSGGTGISISGLGYSIEYATTLGDRVCAAGQCRTITYIYSGTGANIDSPFSPEVTSVPWTSQWSTAPSDYAVGEPVSQKMPHFLGPTIVSDVFRFNNENIRILAKNSPTSWTVERGCSYFEAACSGTGSAHTAGDAMITGGVGGSFGEGLQYYWDFVADPHAIDSNAGDPSNSGNHALAGVRYPTGFSGSHQTSRGNIRAMAGGFIMAAAGGLTNRRALGKPANYPLSTSDGFGFNGRYAQDAGNTYQRHPSNHQSNLNSGYQYDYFMDFTPFVGGLGWIDSATPSVQVEGSVYKVGRPNGNGDVLTSIDRKSMPTLAVCGQKALADISGPSSHIVNATASYTYCFAEKNGECRGGGDIGGASVAGDQFVSCPVITVGFCSGAENYAGVNDICVGNQTPDGNSTVQSGVRIPPNESTVIHEQSLRLRTLAKAFVRPRYGDANAKILPDGSWMLHPAVHDGSLDMFLLKNPGMPPLDSVNRRTFVPVRMKLSPPAALGVNNAYVEFGYDSSLQCTARAEVCVAAANNNPYFFAGETFSGVPCDSGCAIDVPSIPSRVLWYRFTYRNASNVKVGQSGVNSVAVP